MCFTNKKLEGSQGRHLVEKLPNQKVPILLQIKSNTQRSIVSKMLTVNFALWFIVTVPTHTGMFVLLHTSNLLLVAFEGALWGKVFWERWMFDDRRTNWTPFVILGTVWWVTVAGESFVDVSYAVSLLCCCHYICVTPACLWSFRFAVRVGPWPKEAVLVRRSCLGWLKPNCLKEEESKEEVRGGTTSALRR